MGQFLVVRGRDAERARAVFESALRAHLAIHGQRPEATARAGAGTWLAKFARRRVAGTTLVRDAATGDCTLAAGAFVAPGASDGLDATAAGDTALRRVGAALRAGGDLRDAALRTLDGYFAIVAAHGQGGGFVVVTDRVGGLHAYTAVHDGCRIVGTSSLVLARVLRAPPDPLAVREMLSSASVFEDRSLFRGVTKLGPGELLSAGAEGSDGDGTELVRSRWWTLADHVWDRAPPRTAEDLAGETVAAVRTLLAAHPRPVLDLTGGFDSRNLLGAALRTGLPFATVVNGQPGDADVRVAGEIARTFGLDHRHQCPGRDFPEPVFADFQAAAALGDGEANVFDYAPTFLAQSRTADEFDLSVNGSFGELCRGYWWDLLGLRLRSRSSFRARAFAAGRFGHEAAWADRLCPDLARAGAVLDHFTAAVERSVADLAGARSVALADAVYVRMRMQRWGGRIVSLTSRVRPSAAPFMFRGPLSAALAMPPGARMFGRGARHLVAALDPRLAALATDSGAPAGPLRPWNAHRFLPLWAGLARKAVGRVRRRLGGTPSDGAASTTWRAGDVWRLPEIADLLDPQRMLARELCDGRALAAFVAECREQRASPSPTLGRLVTLELALRSQRDGGGPA